MVEWEGRGTPLDVLEDCDFKRMCCNMGWKCTGKHTWKCTGKHTQKCNKDKSVNMSQFDRGALSSKWIGST